MAPYTPFACSMTSEDFGRVAVQLHLPGRRVVAVVVSNMVAWEQSMKFDTLTTSEFALAINRSRDHLRKERARKGHYRGIYPQKRQNGQWCWPADAVAKLRAEDDRIVGKFGSSLTTAEFALAIGRSIEHLRQSLHEKGNYRGVVPVKRPNGHLAWPADAVAKLKQGGAK